MPSIDFTILDDQPVTQSPFFQFEEYSVILAEAITSAKTPITLGIFGEWGTGKTTLMQMIKRNINVQNKDAVLAVWFDAWRYENEPNVIIPLLYTIRDELLSVENELKEEILDFLDKFLPALGKGLETSISTGVVSTSFKPKDMIEAYESFKKNGLFGNAIYYDMFRYLREEINRWGIRFVIFIDDLDRCNPEKTLATLEAIQLFLNTQGVAVIVGASNLTLENAISKKYESVGIDGRAFLKKIFPASFTIPPFALEHIRAYIAKLLDIAQGTTEEKEKLTHIFAIGADANPREIKKIINAYVLTRELLKQNKPFSSDISKTALFTVIQQEWPRAFRDISIHKEEFVQFCQWLNEHRHETQLEIPKYASSMLSIDSEILQFLKSAYEEIIITTEEVDIYIHALTSASLQSLLPAQMNFTHNTKLIETNPDKWKWTLEPDITSRVLEKIEQIEYRLPTNMYAHHIRIAKRDDGFTLEDEAPNNVPIEISIMVKFKGINEPEIFHHTIFFSAPS